MSLLSRRTHPRILPGSIRVMTARAMWCLQPFSSLIFLREENTKKPCDLRRASKRDQKKNGQNHDMCCSIVRNSPGFGLSGNKNTLYCSVENAKLTHSNAWIERIKRLSAFLRTVTTSQPVSQETVSMAHSSQRIDIAESRRTVRELHHMKVQEDHPMSLFPRVGA